MITSLRRLSALVCFLLYVQCARGERLNRDYPFVFHVAASSYGASGVELTGVLDGQPMVLTGVAGLLLPGDYSLRLKHESLTKYNELSRTYALPLENGKEASFIVVKLCAKTSSVCNGVSVVTNDHLTSPSGQ